MLLAEIQGKLTGTFGCTASGSDGIDPEAAVTIEDANGSEGPLARSSFSQALGARHRRV